MYITHSISIIIGPVLVSCVPGRSQIHICILNTVKLVFAFDIYQRKKPTFMIKT